MKKKKSCVMKDVVLFDDDVELVEVNSKTKKRKNCFVDK